MDFVCLSDLQVGGVAEYRASEGKTVEVPYRGGVLGTAQDILGKYCFNSSTSSSNILFQAASAVVALMWVQVN